MQGDVVSKTLNPVWGALPPAFNKAVPDAKTIKQPTILEFETFKDTIAQQTLEVVLWDKDRFSSVRGPSHLWANMILTSLCSSE